ncbi:MAG: YHYH protein, partial [Phycisphaerales bacterium]
IREANESRVAAALATGEKPPQAAIFDAFAPFVKTRFDERWLYVESDGLPHEPLKTKMMVGIRAWQQQVPLPQDYSGANAWQIPLKPELADKPIPGRDNLRKGAGALAANGIPIFTALNNGGRDSFAIGELDEFGGHCGRADDYHYHAAPLALERIVGKGKPIAYALDGFPIYGLFDPKAKAGDDLACPCGSHEPLDELNGHFCEVPKGEGLGGGTRSYHYHSSKTFPYINGGLRGKVQLSGAGPENEVVPQAHANPVRPALPPLRGARITGFEETGEKAWKLTYEVAGKSATVAYRVESDGKVQFTFTDANGEVRSETYSPRGVRGAARPPREGQDGAPRGGEQGGARGGRRPRGEDQQPPARNEPKSGFTLASSGIGASGLLDAKHTCDGASIAPPFSWSGVPAGP